MNTVFEHKLSRFFSGEQLAIATKHGKETVLQPLLTQNLGVSAFVVPDFDTDRFGTFSGETRRRLNPLDTARQKCFEACHQTGCNLALSSEGSFGSHPVFGFIPANEELLLLVDRRHNLEFKAVHLSTHTNFAGREVASWNEAREFAEKALFPSHGLMVRAHQDDISEVHKGITDWPSLQSSYQYFQQRHGRVFLETDMRALYNPTRMQVIAEAGQKLIEVLSSLCPECDTPGFTVAEKKPGLPCRLCYRPTASTLLEVYRCVSCGHQSQKWFPLHQQTEDPQYCDHCNP